VGLDRRRVVAAAGWEEIRSLSVHGLPEEIELLVGHRYREFDRLLRFFQFFGYAGPSSRFPGVFVGFKQRNLAELGFS
jgi:hypothetical protein